MPIFTFEGFTAGSLVAMSAAQGAQGAAGSVPEWRLSNMNTATLDIARIEPAELVAPAGIWFEATAIAGFAVSEPADPDGGRAYDPTAHDITYIWDFDDPGQFTAPLNIPTVWNNKSIDYGKKAYHVFDTPGTYVVRLWAIDREGTTGERMVSITVLDPDEVYTGVRTICVSNQGDFTGAPAGARLLTSLAAAQSAYRALGGTGRLLLRRGETYQENTYDIDDPQVNHRVGAFGTGNKPILRPWEPAAGETLSGSLWSRNVFSFRNGNLVTDSIFYDLRFEGDWDAAKETGDGNGQAIFYGTHNSANGWHVTLYRCEFAGLVGLYPGNAGVTAYTSAIVDCDITNWRDYGIFPIGRGYDPDFRLAIVGSAIHAKQDACEGGHGKIGLANDHGAFRYEDVINVIISSSDFYAASSWPGPGQVQPCIRFAQNGNDAPAGTNYYIQCNRMACEGGSGIMGIDGQNDEAPEIPGNHIFDMLLLVGSYATSQWFNASYGGTTCRNAIMVSPDMAKTTSGERFVNFHVDNPASGNADAPQVFTHNTFLSYESSVIAEQQNGANFNALTFENNVNHQPNASTTPDAPVDITQAIAGFTPRNRGRRVGPAKVSTTVSGVGQNGTFTIAYPSGTGQADFSPGGRHTVKIGNGFWYSHRGHISLAFGVSNITVTNLSSVTMTGTAQLGLDQDTLTTDATYASPASVPLPVPQSGSQALIDEGGLQAYTQFDTGQRTRPKGAV